MTDALSVKNLKKSFGALTAVNDISFQVKKGSCFGLLGPNGAGKTTTLEIIEGLVAPDSGEINYPLKPQSMSRQAYIGIQFQDTALQDHITVGETLNMFADLYGKRENLSRLIELCALSDFLSQDTRKLSGGQRQRLLLALALVHDPEVVYLDEPTTGLDPQARRNFWQLVESIKQQGKTLVLTTHYMDEAQTLCDEIVILDKGKIIQQGCPQQLLSDHFNGHMIQLPESLFPAVSQVITTPITRGNLMLEFASQDITHDLQQLMAANIPLTGLKVHQPNLEDLFIKLTGHQLRG
ncbi:MAG: ABC transporter ATP-binding protein [Gammaproteobacteria bacterium]|nr:ABC transporter ATP-binding protein [Gammaproteobacteria bacterium]NVK87342.1 ABC transporter ATP-binding protein [Gammaproteobacteria bacterium]